MEIESSAWPPTSPFSHCAPTGAGPALRALRLTDHQSPNPSWSRPLRGSRLLNILSPQVVSPNRELSRLLITDTPNAQLRVWGNSGKTPLSVQVIYLTIQKNPTHHTKSRWQRSTFPYFSNEVACSRKSGSPSHGSYLENFSCAEEWRTFLWFRFFVCFKFSGFSRLSWLYFTFSFVITKNVNLVSCFNVL